MVDATKKLIELYQGKIKEKIDEVWGEEVFSLFPLVLLTRYIEANVAEVISNSPHHNNSRFLECLK